MPLLLNLDELRLGRGLKSVHALARAARPGARMKWSRLRGTGGTLSAAMMHGEETQVVADAGYSIANNHEELKGTCPDEQAAVRSLQGCLQVPGEEHQQAAGEIGACESVVGEENVVDDGRKGSPADRVSR